MTFAHQCTAMNGARFIFVIVAWLALAIYYVYNVSHLRKTPLLIPCSPVANTLFLCWKNSWKGSLFHWNKSICQISWFILSPHFTKSLNIIWHSVLVLPSRNCFFSWLLWCHTHLFAWPLFPLFFLRGHHPVPAWFSSFIIYLSLFLLLSSNHTDLDDSWTHSRWRSRLKTHWT